MSNSLNVLVWKERNDWERETWRAFVPIPPDELDFITSVVTNLELHQDDLADVLDGKFTVEIKQFDDVKEVAAKVAALNRKDKHGYMPAGRLVDWSAHIRIKLAGFLLALNDGDFDGAVDMVYKMGWLS